MGKPWPTFNLPLPGERAAMPLVIIKEHVFSRAKRGLFYPPSKQSTVARQPKQQRIHDGFILYDSFAQSRFLIPGSRFHGGTSVLLSSEEWEFNGDSQRVSLNIWH
jgi:hypothetical protein